MCSGGESEGAIEGAIEGVALDPRVSIEGVDSGVDPAASDTPWTAWGPSR